MTDTKQETPTVETYAEEIQNFFAGQLLQITDYGEYEPLDQGTLLGKALQNFYTDLCKNNAKDEANEFMSGFIRSLDHDVLGQVLLQFPMTDMPDLPEGELDKHLAVDVAKTLGPDWAQTLYRFSVLVTKLA